MANDKMYDRFVYMKTNENREDRPLSSDKNIQSNGNRLWKRKMG